MTSSEHLFKIPFHLSNFWDLLGNACVQLAWFNLYGKADLKLVLAVLTGQAQLREISKEHRRKDTALQWKFRLVCVCVCVCVCLCEWGSSTNEVHFLFCSTELVKGFIKPGALIMVMQVKNFKKHLL